MRNVIPDAWYAFCLIVLALIIPFVLYAALVARGVLPPAQWLGSRRDGDQSERAVGVRPRTTAVLVLAVGWTSLLFLFHIEIAPLASLAFMMIGAVSTVVTLRSEPDAAQQSSLTWSDVVLGSVVPLGILAAAKNSFHDLPPVGLDVGYSASAGFAWGFTLGWLALTWATAREAHRRST